MDAPRQAIRQAITDVDEATLARWLDERGEPRYRVRQGRRAVARSRANDWSGLTDLPARLRDDLAQAYP